MNVGFDPGAHDLRVLWRRGDKLVARQIRAAYALLSDEPVHRQILVDSRLAFARCEGHLVLLGDAVSEIGRRFHAPTWPLMPDGQILQDETLTNEVLIANLDALLPPARTSDAFCGFSVPQKSVHRDGGRFDRTSDFLSHWLRLRGYTPVDISPGRALVLAELSATGFTGLAVTFGAAFCSYSLCHQGTELATGYIARGGQWLDNQLAKQLQRYCSDSAGESWPDCESITSWKIGDAPSLISPRDPQQSLLRDLYRELLTEVYHRIFDDLIATQLPRFFPPVKLLLSGGLTRTAGFRELLAALWLDTGLPIQIEEIWMANDSPFSISRGCLIQAEMAGQAEMVAA